MSSVQKTALPEQDPSSMQFARMQIDDLPEVLWIEYGIYPHPWTRGNFKDSLHSGYETWVLRNARGMLTGYFLMMFAVDEAHLLNITVRSDMQGQGLGRKMLNKVGGLAREKGIHSILLEVRPSNRRALAIYNHYGFSEIGLRKNYYPGANDTREDAIVMRLPI
jgi:ribosomal-protein-alanine N-acetyltransferase